MYSIETILFSTYISHLSLFWYYSTMWYFLSKKIYDIDRSIDVAKYTLYIQTTILPYMSYIFYIFYRKYDIMNYPEYTLYELYQWCFMFFWTDFMTYHIHILLHHPYCYKIHKLHHSWKYPVPWGSLYSSYTENIILNFFPVFTAPLIIELNIYYVYIWFMLATFTALYSHSFDSSSDHLIHHKYGRYNYGITTFFDRLYNTYRLK
jgi:sterol desaturase/sphingolipid hydroxylase (fatty acid hydroxylase superfamily)